MGAYGKAYTLLYLIGAVTILTSCVKDDLYDTPHPDRGAVEIQTFGFLPLSEQIHYQNF